MNQLIADYFKPWLNARVNDLQVDGNLTGGNIEATELASNGQVGFVYDDGVDVVRKDIEITDLQDIATGAPNNTFLKHELGTVSFASVPSLPGGTIDQILRHDGVSFVAVDQIVDSNLPTNPTISGDLTVVGNINAGSISGDIDVSDIDASSANPGDVLTVDGSNVAVWQAPSGGLPAGSLNDVLVHDGVSFVSQPQIVMSNIPINSIDNPKLQSNSVSTVKIQDNAVSTNKIQDDAVNGDKLADLSVDTPHLVDGSVVEAKIGSGAVTEDKIATDAVTTIKIFDGAVTVDKLATDSVSTIKIQDGAVTTDKINDDAVTTDKILDANVTPAKIQPGTNGQVLQTVGGNATWATYSVESYFAKTGGTPLAAAVSTRITYTDASILNPLGLSNISGVISGFNAAKFYLFRFKCQVNDYTNGDSMTMILRQEAAPNNTYDTYRNNTVLTIGGTIDDTCNLIALVDGSQLTSGISVFVSAKSGSMTVTDPRLTVRQVN